MGKYAFRLPDIGEGIAEAEISEWYVAVGDTVEEDQQLVDVMTDKATVDISSPVSGKVVSLNGAVGDMLAVGSVLVEFEVEGDADAVDDGGQGDSTSPEAATQKASDAEPPQKDEPAQKRQAPAEAKSGTFAASAKQTASPSASKPAKTAADAAKDGSPAMRRGAASGKGSGAPLASPATRRKAHEHGIALQYVTGTGPAGRILEADLEAYIADGAPKPGGGSGLRQRTGVDDIRIVGMRRRIAEKMQQSKRSIPHFCYVEEFDMTALEDLRATMNAGRGEDQSKLTVLPFLIRAVARLLPDYPMLNGHYDEAEEAFRAHEAFHAGIATQTERGLSVPVVRHAESLGVWDCAAEIRRVSEAAREGTASRDELSGSTLTITSLGPLGGISATPVINHPEVGIIGPNKMVERPVVIDGRIEIRKIMNLSSSFDHRIVDGYDAARFIQDLKRLIECPALIFAEDE
ncbi:branched-chain alpha-keto acid dehydrogenase subunit E2 [Notoacmeibacter marinus]|uniref:Dihydrolipoamide acetyltransferase component of pyruvate dehydrogenase complex n=1 Tax=Notoacmeibacter marinus TaxID=1876515 RepID=A0A231UT63_9HYPH|nr:dihydrolipoamide acetyltransferase family protein [Notoacmeibacter marinus]OXS99020.1 branched-chain alpha-keto acid dehydrogenase subunit E2 [Notoacmeibacter marinus]